jgi:Tfp pilus assembly protein PilW
MRMSPASGIRLIADERGFSLIELLVAMIGSIVVVFAAFAIYIVALHQSSRIGDRVQADQSGRTAIARVVEELHSGCMQKEFTPVQAKSTPSELRFDDAASSEPQIGSSKAKPEAYQDRVSVKSGTLTDERYPVESGTLPKEFIYNETTPSSKLQLATNVAETEEKGKVPYFKYYEYAKAASAGSETSGVNALTEVKPGEKGLSAEQAAKVTAVEVNFTVSPRESNAAQSGQKVPFTNEVIFSLGLPGSEATIEDTPCQ